MLCKLNQQNTSWGPTVFERTTKNHIFLLHAVLSSRNFNPTWFSFSLGWVMDGQITNLFHANSGDCLLSNNVYYNAHIENVECTRAGRYHLNGSISFYLYEIQFHSQVQRLRSSRRGKTLTETFQKFAIAIPKFFRPTRGKSTLLGVMDAPCRSFTS